MDRGFERSERDPASETEDSRLTGEARILRELSSKGSSNRDQNQFQHDTNRHESAHHQHTAARSRDAERPNGQRHREASRSGRETYVVSSAERQTLREIGRFRVIKISDLSLYRYEGRAGELTQDLRNLARQGLLQRKTVWTGRHREQVTYLALTRAAKSFLQRDAEGVPQQAIYGGFVKPAELRHDAAIYPMFQKESARIASEGGQVGRIILDYELKKRAYSPLAKAKALPANEYAKRQAEIAREHGLKVVNGHIALPDLRVEYITREGLAASVDLELATESYHGSHAAEKAAAGFRIYAAPDTAARLSAALDEREITAEILSL